MSLEELAKWTLNGCLCQRLTKRQCHFEHSDPENEVLPSSSEKLGRVRHDLQGSGLQLLVHPVHESLSLDCK